MHACVLVCPCATLDAWDLQLRLSTKLAKRWVVTKLTEVSTILQMPLDSERQQQLRCFGKCIKLSTKLHVQQAGS